MGKLEIKQPDNHEKELLAIARDLFFDSISLEKVKGLTQKDKEKIEYYYTCLEKGDYMNSPNSEEQNMKMTA